MTRLAVAAQFLLLTASSGSLLNAAPCIAITEIHYHPAQGEALEFIEIFNREPPRAELSGWRLAGEVEFEFPASLALLLLLRRFTGRNKARR